MLSNAYKRPAYNFGAQFYATNTTAAATTHNNNNNHINLLLDEATSNVVSNNMSLWKRIACNPEVEQRMKQYYDEKGLGDLRVLLAPWIEERILSERLHNSNNSSYERVVLQFYEDLQQKIIGLSSDSLMKFKLNEICTLLTQTPAVDLYNHVRNGLQKEIQLLEQMPQNSYMCGVGGGGNTANIAGGVVGVGVGLGSCGNNIGVPPGLDSASSSVGGDVNMSNNSALAACVGGGVVGSGIPGGIIGGPLLNSQDDLYLAHRRIQELNRELEHMRVSMQTFQTDSEAFGKSFNEYNQTKHLMPEQRVLETDAHVEEQIAHFLNRRNTLALEMRRIIIEYDGIQTAVINELKNWQRNQALAGNGAQFRDNLDNIQGCIEMLVDIICKMLQYVNALVCLNVESVDLNNMVNQIRRSQEMLVVSAFIVEKQPPQVMKTNTRFAASVRWLIGPQMNIHMGSPKVDCIILSEAQAQRHSSLRSQLEISSDKPPHSGEIVSNECIMEYQAQTRHFSASFRNMQLRKIKRAEKKGTESVMDEKFALLFYTTCRVSDYHIRVWTLSLPVVVIVHGNQEPQSWATITWDNAFSDIVREPFMVPEKVSWSQLSYALNTKFASTTGRPLTEENLNFLYEKLFRNDGKGGDHKDYITWAQFCKEPLPNRTFTFWDWFFAIMKLTKDQLLGLWKAGLVVGFINKDKTMNETLVTKCAGTFLLRFSDSELGGITVAFVNQEGKVLMLSPWTARDLQIRGLADRVHDLEVLRFVYPTDRDRDEAFREFYTHRMEQTASDGYVPNTIRAHVPAIEGGSLNATPQHFMQSPHPQNMPMSNDNFNIDFDFNGFEQL